MKKLGTIFTGLLGILAVVLLLMTSKEQDVVVCGMIVTTIISIIILSFALPKNSTTNLK